MDVFKSLIGWVIALGLVVILFPVFFIIWLLVFPFDKRRVVIHWLLIYQCILIVKFVPIWEVSIEGREKAKKGTTYVIISNHQSIIDILMINCLQFRFKWISKIENMNVPVIGWYLRMAGYFTVNRGDEESKSEMLDKSYRSLQQGTSIMIFPEGTRSLGKEPGFFRRGAFMMALNAQVPILPVVIDGTGDILPKHGWRLKGGYHIRIRVLDPVLPDSFGTENPDELALKLRAIIVEELNNLRLSNIQNAT
jgi:1-acyl-sn-glycerol-3-phosphate acyltransferase